jgi:PAS domain S-box-containing protein
LIRDLSDKIQCRRLTQVHSERFQSLFNISFDGIMIIQDSKIVAANRAASLLYGLEPELLLHTPSHVLLHSNIIVSEPTETDGTYKDGSTLQLLFSSTSITWNELPAHLVTIKNVSEMRQLRKALVSKFDGLDMICVFDSNFKIKFTNSYFKQYYNCEHTVGKDIRELIPTSDRDTFAIKINALTKTNPTVRNQVQHITETGESRLLDWIDHAVFDDNGNVIEYQRTGRDITSVLINLMQHPE